MPGADEKILIVGVGGIGGIVAARLLERGYDLTLVTGNSSITDAINRNGLCVRERGDLRITAARARTTTAELPREARFSAVYLLTKANHAADAAIDALPHLRSDGYVVTFQNGYVLDAVAQGVEAERILCGVVGFSGTMCSPGVYERTHQGVWFVGEHSGRRSERVERLAEVLEHVAPARVSGNIRGVLWAKLCLNCSVTALGALSGSRLRTLLDADLERALFFETIREVVSTAERSGVQIEKLAIEPSLLRLPAEPGWLRSPQLQQLSTLLVEHYGNSKPSLLQSLERRRPTEIDFICGYVARCAQAAGVQGAINRGITRMMHEIERGERKIERANLRQLAAEVQIVAA